ncbi:ATP-binding protein [uncultured Phenylobacterium sp.]|uniref:PAS domain-containing hybrid sensor histidine kinase/response regulator n=1 Tax=uncultured Phenylobacterium sp. TaxID=349273 RepID=UPI0025D489E6|nr:ATP-binding protein [uncultured Phenylobacterium sp.]
MPNRKPKTAAWEPSQAVDDPFNVAGRPNLGDGRGRTEAEIAQALIDFENLKVYQRAIDTHQIVAMTDRQGRIQHVSDMFCAISGYSREELLGRTHAVVNSGLQPRKFWVDLWRTIGRGRTWSGEICNRTKAGDIYWVQSTIFPLHDATGKHLGFLAVRSDITGLKNAKAALLDETRRLEEARDAAEAASRAKTEFAATVSHEIRTPMNGVLGMLTVLLDTKLDPRQRHWAETARDSARGLLALLNDVLDFSKLEADAADLELIACNPGKLAGEVVALLTDQARAKGVTLRAVVAADVPPQVVCDPTKLRQVLFNLAGNALKFTSEGAVAITVSLAHADPEQMRLHVKISDTGCGIDAGAIPRLFDRFTQADSSTTRTHGGTGLGLAISKKLVERMGGEIGATSTQGVGSTFWFTLPCGIADEVADAPDAAILDVPGPGLRILVAEDNAVNQRVIEAMLDTFGYVIDLAANGEEAVGMFRRGLFYDLVLMDIQMPEKDGMMATREIRALSGAARSVPIIALTANVFDEQRAAYMAAGMDDVVAKPIDLELLMAAIARAMQGRETVAEQGKVSVAI